MLASLVLASIRDRTPIYFSQQLRWSSRFYTSLVLRKINSEILDLALRSGLNLLHHHLFLILSNNRESVPIQKTQMPHPINTGTHSSKVNSGAKYGKGKTISRGKTAVVELSKDGTNSVALKRKGKTYNGYQTSCCRKYLMKTSSMNLPIVKIN